MAKDIKELSKSLHGVLDELVNILVEHETRLGKLEGGASPRASEVIPSKAAWTEGNFRNLKENQVRILLYLLRNEGPHNTKVIREKLGMTEPDCTAAIGGFTQRTRQEKIVEKTSRSRYRFIQGMRGKYTELIERAIGSELEE